MLTVNLAKVVNDEKGEQTYALDTSPLKAKQTFHLIINVLFNDGECMKRNTKTFLVKGKQEEKKVPAEHVLLNNVVEQMTQHFSLLRIDA